MRPLPALVLVLALDASGCARTDPAVTPSEEATKTKVHNAGGPVGSTKVVSLTVNPENLNVDKVSMRDGGIRPDGNRDLVFRATVEGPADALYLVNVNEKGAPQYGFRADTINGHEELPSELGSVIDVGSLTVWIAVVENGRFINTDNGGLGNLPAGSHSLKLYVPNPGNLRPGSHLRLYARAASGGLAGGPVVAY